jgi:hypothetical protein
MKSATEKPQHEGLQNLSQKTTAAGHHHLKTDAPLSEKDEVKQAEENMRKPRRKML